MPDLKISPKLTQLKARIDAYAMKYGRPAGAVQLLAVSKGQSIAHITAAYQAGQRSFGENYLQEALGKMAALADLAIEWHFIGTLQSNKTRKIAEHFSWVHSVSSIPLAERLNNQRPSHLPPLNICLQVNSSQETSKSGISAVELLPLAQACLSLPRLTLRGLMALPAPTTDPEVQQQSFHEVFLLWQSLRSQGIPLDTLSMGTSSDLEAAIAQGATMVRIGQALFGPRQG